ncbi:hypothetical protein V8C40DRAFT_249769 [Trichoderma camerunense]
MEQCYSVHPLQYANRACCMQILPRISAAAPVDTCTGTAIGRAMLWSGRMELMYSVQVLSVPSPVKG